MHTSPLSAWRCLRRCGGLVGHAEPRERRNDFGGLIAGHECRREVRFLPSSLPGPGRGFPLP